MIPAVLILALLASAPALAADGIKSDTWRYPVRADRVVDGDTVMVTVQHGLHIQSVQSLRLSGFDAPEKADNGGPEATQALTRLLATCAETFLVTDRKREFGSFGRVEGRLLCDEMDLSDEMVRLGHVK